MVQGFWSRMREKLETANKKLVVALACYLVLIGLAFYALLPVRTRMDSFLLIAVLGLLVYLMIKTLAHADED